MMQITVHSHRQIIEAALARHPEAVVLVTICLWQRLAPELVSIIGEGGFKPLYARSVRLSCAQYPWLAPAAAAAPGEERFAPLQALLQAQDLTQALQGSAALFNIFLDLLASLIGEVLTTHLLSSAWSQGTSATPAKDFSR
jgi:DNA-binding GntR family transcriptional regulator